MPAIPDVIKPPADMPYIQISMLQATIRELWRAYLDSDGDPGNPEAFWKFMTDGGLFK